MRVKVLQVAIRSSLPAAGAVLYFPALLRGSHFIFAVLGLALIGPGCVRRSLTVTTDPPGALVYLNGQEFGRTPVTRDFTWYGNYDVAIRKEGYETLKTGGKVIAPWWQWVPFDLVAELFPLHDRQKLSYTLKPTPEEAVEPQAILSRAEQLRGKLQSSPNTRPPSTVPTTAPAQ